MSGGNGGPPEGDAVVWVWIARTLMLLVLLYLLLRIVSEV